MGGHFSAASKMYDEQFEAMSKTYSKYSFYKCDVDDCPLAAYDAEVESVPSIVILPVGMKPDGSPYDKTDMIVVGPELAEFDNIVPRAKAALDSLTIIEDTTEKTAWAFDPATGTTMPPHK